MIMTMREREREKERERERLAGKRRKKWYRLKWKNSREKCRRAGRREAEKLGVQLFEDWKGNGSRGWPRFSFTRQKLRAISPLTQKSLANGLPRKHVQEGRWRSKEIVNSQIQRRRSFLFPQADDYVCFASKKLLNFFSPTIESLNVNRDLVNSSLIEQIDCSTSRFFVSV